ncbi:Hpt domain-containing protein [Hymenobacter sp. BT190]|nr:Hpt domain-containing protein [Hymenobacter sp. BT190]
MLKEAETLVGSGQYAGILPHLHQLKGTGFTLGLTALAECAKHLEHELKLNPTQNIEKDFQNLLRYFVQFKAQYLALTSAE